MGGCSLKSAGRPAAIAAMAGALLLASSPGWAAAESILIPNGSFESPSTSFVTLLFDSWQRLPKPEDYVESGGFLWNQLTGVFVNTQAGAVDHITNLDGTQALWVFAVPRAGVFQELTGAGGTASAEFLAGRSYRLGARILGAGGNMLDGASLTLALYYRDGASNAVEVASLVLTNRSTLFPSRNQLLPVELRSPVLAVGHPAVGRPIGIRVESTVTPALQGGYWDVDDLRLESLPAPVPVLSVEHLAGKLQIRWPAEAGWRYQLRRSTSQTAWAPVGDPLAGMGGDLTVTVPAGQEDHEFFVVTAVPAP